MRRGRRDYYGSCGPGSIQLELRTDQYSCELNGSKLYEYDIDHQPERHSDADDEPSRLMRSDQ